MLLSEAVGRVQSQAAPPSQHLVLVLDKVKSWAQDKTGPEGNEHDEVLSRSFRHWGCVTGDSDAGMLFLGPAEAAVGKHAMPPSTAGHPAALPPLPAQLLNR